MFHALPFLGITLRSSSMLVLAAVLGSAPAGCTTGDKASKTSDMNPTPSSERQARLDREAQMLEAVEKEFAIGPRAARSLGYRLTWQDGSAGQDLKFLSPQGDSVFLLSGTNLLERLSRETGSRIWTATVGSPVAEVLGLTYLPDEKRVFVTRDSSIMALESPTGVLAGDQGKSPVQNLQWIANTAPVVFDQFFIYGARAGELVWQAYDIGHSYRAYKVGRSIQLPPVLSGDTVVAAATGGRIIAINAQSVSARWQHEIPGDVLATPAMGATAVYVASDDQYLRAFDLFSGRLLWRALTEAPLRTSPMPMGRHVYQDVPGFGFACYEAMPRGQYDGRRLWLNPAVSGEVLTARDNRLLIWNAPTRDLYVVSKTTGVVEQKLELDRVDRLVSDAPEDGRLYSLDNRGRLDCLVPMD